MLSHHAYSIEDSLERFAAYRDELRESESLAENDPNFFAHEYEKFGIDEARELIHLASLRSSAGRALFFIAASSMTTEAQQALLKLLEEPQEGTVFVLLVPHGTLLPTLQSRMLAYPRLAAAAAGSRQAKEFLASPYKARSEWIATFLKDEENARERTRQFFVELEGELYPGLGKSREVREGLQDIAHFRQYLSDRSPSLKMILEHLAATLPKV